MKIRKLSMMHNKRTLLLAKPPTVIFLVCLISFTLILFGFIIYINKYEIHNPDELDWNIFREKMASLDYCMKYPSDKSERKIYNQNQEIDPKKNSYFYDLTFDVDYWGSLDELKNLKIFKGKIDGVFIGKEAEILDIEFQINKIKKNPIQSCNKRIINEKECHEYLISGCISLTASSKIFPKSQAPKTCSFKKKVFINQKVYSNQTSDFIVYKETPDLPHDYWCPATFGAKSIIKNSKDPNLTIFLTQKDKDLICKNLLYLIVALIIVITFVSISIFIDLKKKESPYSYNQVIDM